MHLFKSLVVTVLVVACFADETSKHPSNDPKTRVEQTTPVIATSTDGVQLAAMKDSGGHNGDLDNASTTDANDKRDDKVEPKIGDKSVGAETDLKGSATLGLGFYGGVVPFRYSPYPVYNSPYRYVKQTYWSPRGYWGGYSYRPIPVIVKTLPVPVLVG